MNDNGSDEAIDFLSGGGDMGRLIGKRGRVVQALRQVTRAAGAAEGIRASVDIVE